MNLIDQMNVLKGLRDEDLQAEMQMPSGGAPPWLIATEVTRRKDMRQRYEGEMARRKPSTTVVEDLAVLPTPPALNASMGPTPAAPGGIDSAMAPQGFADGGIVHAYAEGGRVSYDDIAARYNEELGGLDRKRDTARALALIAAGGGLMGGSPNTLRNIGGGLNAFANSYSTGLQTVDSREADLLRGLMDVGQAQNAEELARLDRDFRERELVARASGNSSYFAPVAGTVDGKPTYLQFSNDGNVRVPEVPEGFVPQSRFEKIDAGDSWIIKDLTTGQTEIVPKQGAPGTNMNVEGLGTERVLTPAPGSAEALERAAAAEKKVLADAQAAQTADIVTNDIDRAISSIEANPALTTGWGAALTQDLPAGPAADAKKLIETVEANVSFDKLQQMRASSPTGAALGPVSDFENRLLQAVVGNLKLSQNKEQLLYNLERVKELYTKIVNEGIPDPANPRPTTGAAAPVVSGTVGNVQFTVEPD
jgi:hypothetical protein